MQHAATLQLTGEQAPLTTLCVPQQPPNGHHLTNHVDMQCAGPAGRRTSAQDKRCHNSASVYKATPLQQLHVACCSKVDHHLSACGRGYQSVSWLPQTPVERVSHARLSLFLAWKNASVLRLTECSSMPVIVRLSTELCAHQRVSPAPLNSQTHKQKHSNANDDTSSHTLCHTHTHTRTHSHTHTHTYHLHAHAHHMLMSPPAGLVSRTRWAQTRRTCPLPACRPPMANHRRGPP